MLAGDVSLERVAEPSVGPRLGTQDVMQVGVRLQNVSEQNSGGGGEVMDDGAPFLFVDATDSSFF